MSCVLDDIVVDKTIPVPIYYQLKQAIARLIGDDLLKPGDSLPSESDLCTALGISRPTVRQAFSALAADGLLVRQKGKGTYVSSPKIDAQFFSKLESFNDEMRQKGLVPSTRVLRFERAKPDPAINSLLGLPAGAALLCLERLRFANAEPSVHVCTWLPCQGLEGMLNTDFASRSLYDTLEAQYGLRVHRVTREIEAVNAKAAEARALDLRPGDAVCRVRTVAYTEAAFPVEYSVAYYRGDRNRFHVDLLR